MAPAPTDPSTSNLSSRALRVLGPRARRIGPIAALLLASLVLPSCSSRRDEAPAAAPPARIVDALARQSPAIARTLARARSAPRVTERGVLVATRGLYAEIGAAGSIALRGEASLSFRVPATTGAPRVEGSHAVLGERPGASAGATTVLFDRGVALELLHRLEAPTSLSYELELPKGASLRRVEDGASGVVEVLDDAKVARVRLTADAAWDRDGRPIPVRLRLRDGARVAIEVPDGVAYPIVIDPEWSVTTYPTRLRAGHTSTMLGTGQVLLAGGGSPTAEVFDPISGRFSAVGGMVYARPGHSATLLRDGTVLIAGGLTGAPPGDPTTELYDPAARVFRPGPTMATVAGRTYALRLLDGQVLVHDGTHAERLDPVAMTWTAVPLARAMDAAPVLLSDGGVLLASSSWKQRYDPSTGAFAAAGGTEAGFTRSGFGAPTELGAMVFATEVELGPDGTSYTTVAGGYRYTYADAAALHGGLPAPTSVASPAPLLSPEGALLPSGKALFVGASAMAADVDALTWDSPRTLPLDHLGGAAITVLPSGSALVTGGNSGGASIYQEPDAGSVWNPAGSLRVGRMLTRMTRLLDGRVLIAGGQPPSGNTSDASTTAEIWGPSPAWTPTTGSLSSPRVRHTQVLLPSGKVLLAGGVGVSTAELFDPASGTFTATGSLSRERAGATATLLASGKVLVTGGSTTSTAEMYDEAAGTFRLLPATLRQPHEDHGAVLLSSGRVLFVDIVSSELFDPDTETFSVGPTMSLQRDGRTATLLPNGDVLVGGAIANVLLERYVAATNGFTLVGTTDKSAILESAASFPFGRALIGFGARLSGGVGSPETWTFDALAEGGRGATGPMSSTAPARAHGELVQTSRGSLLQAGGDDCAGGCMHTTPCSLETMVLEPRLKALAPAITTAPASIAPEVPFDVVGVRFEGTRDARNRVPIFAFVPASGQGTLYATTLSFDETHAKVRFPSSGLRGKGFLHASVAGLAGAGVLVDLGPAANGASCGGVEACASGHCVDGVCCDTPCQGPCLACTLAKKGSGPDGVCGAIPTDQSTTDACALFQGAPCLVDRQCATGLCVDGICCDARCEGQCEACTVAGSLGTCVPVLGAPKGARAACATGSDACSARRCDGTTRGTCEGYEPPTTQCRVAGCAAGVETLAASCTGSGACPAAATRSCEPYVCGDAACLTRCTADTECTTNYRCVSGKCVTGAYCTDDRTLTTPGAADVSCAPYLCEGQACKTTCASSTECEGGFLCSDGKCVVASTSTVSDGGGCAIASEDRGARGGAALAGLCVALVALARRRGRGAPGLKR